MKKRYAMVIDSSRCINCLVCVTACQLTNEVPATFNRNWVRPGPWETGSGIHYQPGNCMQCERPTCVDACPTGATYRDETTGIIRVNPKLCIACGSCIPACPYGARFRHPGKRIVDKCDFCQGRIGKGMSPACVETCPTRARIFGDTADATSEVSRVLKTKPNVRVVNKKTDTEPAIYYLGVTSPVDWPVEAKAPEAIRLWRDFFNPLVKAVVGMTGLGVVVMLGKQLFSGPSSEEAGEHRSQDHSGPNETKHEMGKGPDDETRND
jgi:Fe-S-cluster-containing dehydrogenase component